VKLIMSTLKLDITPGAHRVPKITSRKKTASSGRYGTRLEGSRKFKRRWYHTVDQQFMREGLSLSLLPIFYAPSQMYYSISIVSLTLNFDRTTRTANRTCVNAWVFASRRNSVPAR
jgi:hypothetical protein